MNILNKENIAIVIPIYKEVLTRNEQLSLRQCKKILGEYAIYFIQPKGINLTNYLDEIPHAKTLEFENSYFANVQGYSQLMLSPFFYKKFFTYKFVLIYQLDAFVFSDDLLFWGNKNYDYVGAPWLSPPPLTKGKPLVNMSTWFINKVGNGGLSLRKVKSHYYNTLIFRPLLKYFIKNEDMFWGLFLYWLNPFFKRPNYIEALNFAFEMDPRKSFEITNHKLPFGVHAWEKYDPEFWKKWIM